jgi:CheY-specific phosphatase CheX
VQFLEKEIQQYTQLVCSTLLGFEVQPLPGHYEASPSDTFTGSVQITGEWNGALLLTLPSSLVNTLTETLFSLEPGKTTTEDRKDAVGELTNMIGGEHQGTLTATLQAFCTSSRTGRTRAVIPFHRNSDPLPIRMPEKILRLISL